jgi:hypothetical protein
LHFSANGSAFGFSSTFFFTYLPNGKTWAMTYVVGGAVTPVGTTSTP